MNIDQLIRALRKADPSGKKKVVKLLFNNYYDDLQESVDLRPVKYTKEKIQGLTCVKTVKVDTDTADKKVYEAIALF